ncbi:hypothetical protein XENOCAPTIV_012317, partial [Xenoophorus captivus]
LDHACSNLIWNLKTREELRDALEGEMRAFGVDRELGNATVISWNHQEFEVKYECLSDEIKIGDYYLRLLLEEDENEESSAIKRSYEFFNELYHRFLLTPKVMMKCLCLQALAIVYGKCFEEIGPFTDTKYIVGMLDRVYKLERDRLILFLNKLILNKVTWKKEGVIQICRTEFWNTGVLTAKTRCWAQGMDGWRPLQAIPQLKWCLLAAGQPVMNESDLATLILNMLITMCSYYPSRDQDNAIIRPLPKIKRMISDNACLPHIVQDIVQRSVLGPVLPEAMVCYLENYEAERFSEIFLGEFDTPEAIWSSEMRRMMIEKIATHIADFSPRLQSNTRALYQYCPIPVISFPQLDCELFCNIYYLRHLCDAIRFPNWPIRDAVSFLDLFWFDSNYLTIREVEKKPPSMSVDDAYDVLNLPKGQGQHEESKIRKAYFRLAQKYHPDKNPEGRTLLEALSRCVPILTASSKPDDMAVQCLPKTAALAVQCVSSFAIDFFLQTHLYHAGVLWHLLVYLFNYDYTLEESGVQANQDTNQQEVANNLAKLSLVALSRLGGYTPTPSTPDGSNAVAVTNGVDGTPPENPTIRKSLAAMLTPYIARKLGTGSPAEYPKAFAASLLDYVGSQAQYLHTLLAMSQSNKVESQQHAERLRFAEMALEALRNVIKNNPDDFTVAYGAGQGEVEVGGVFLRIFIAQPGWVLRKPREFLVSLLETLSELLEKNNPNGESLETVTTAAVCLFSTQSHLADQVPPLGHLPRILAALNHKNNAVPKSSIRLIHVLSDNEVRHSNVLFMQHVAVLHLFAIKTP